MSSANLAPAVTPAVLGKQAEKDAHAIRWCNFLGLPAAMDSPRPINIRQGRREIVVNFETVAVPRHLYFRAAHPNMDIFDPTTNGDSIARWEGDTLVVDTIGFNERFWLDRRGLPHTNQMHTIERFTRANQAQISYEITVDDPGAYTAPWIGKFNLRWESGTELFEYMCQQANYATELMVGDREAVGKSTNVVP
jgi:hypothetical protein